MAEWNSDDVVELACAAEELTNGNTVASLGLLWESSLLIMQKANPLATVDNWVLAQQGLVSKVPSVLELHRLMGLVQRVSDDELPTR